MFILDEDVIHEVGFELLEGAGIERGLLQTALTEIVALCDSLRTCAPPFPSNLFLQFRK